jgi:transposase
MNKERRNYDKEFKKMAVELLESGKSAKEVSSDLGIAPDLIRRWRREYRSNGTGCFSGNGNANLTPEQKEITHLKKELREAQIERDILKKAVSIFSKSDGRSIGS